MYRRPTMEDLIQIEEIFNDTDIELQDFIDEIYCASNLKMQNYCKQGLLQNFLLAELTRGYSIQLLDRTT